MLKRANKAVQWRLSNPRVHKKLTGVVANLTPFVTGSDFSTSDCTGGRRPCLESKFLIRASFWSRFSEGSAPEGFWGGSEMWPLEVSSRRAEPTARSAAFASSFSVSGRCCRFCGCRPGDLLSFFFFSSVYRTRQTIVLRGDPQPLLISPCPAWVLPTASDGSRPKTIALP